MLNNNGVGRVCMFWCGEEGGMISEWASSRIQSSEFPLLPGLPHYNPRYLLEAPVLLFLLFPPLRPAPTPPRSTRTPRLGAHLPTPSPSRPRPFPLNNLIPTRSPTEPSSLSCLPTEPSRFGLPLGLSPSPRSPTPRAPSLGPGPLLTSQTSAPETEPERYTGTGNLLTALRPAVAAATAAAASTLRSPDTWRGRARPRRAADSRSLSSYFLGGGAQAWWSPTVAAHVFPPASFSPAKSVKQITAKYLWPEAEVGLLAVWRISAPKAKPNVAFLVETQLSETIDSTGICRISLTSPPCVKLTVPESNHTEKSRL